MSEVGTSSKPQKNTFQSFEEERGERDRPKHRSIIVPRFTPLGDENDLRTTPQIRGNPQFYRGFVEKREKVPSDVRKFLDENGPNFIQAGGVLSGGLSSAYGQLEL